MRLKTLPILVLCLLLFKCGKSNQVDPIIRDGYNPKVSPKDNVVAFLKTEGKPPRPVLKGYVWDIFEKKIIGSFGDGILSHSKLSWSPDGRKIAGVGFVDQKWNIWIFDPWEGKKPEMITDHQSKPAKQWIASDGRPLAIFPQSMLNPSWSPTGELIAFGYLDRDISTIWIVSIKDKNMYQITSGPSDNQPCFSPDGHKIIYVACSCANESEIMQVTLENKDIQVLISSPFNEIDPAWSPDGKYVAFVSDRDGSNQVWIRSLPDSLEYQFTREKGVTCYSPTWTPDGRNILYHKGEIPGIWMKEFDFEKLRTPPVISLN